jgi:cell division protein FtsB
VQYFNNQAEQSDSTVTNSRLQKAIERNRARMQKKEGISPMASNQPLRGVPVSRRSLPSSRNSLNSTTPQRKTWSRNESDKSVENRLEKLRQKRALRKTKSSSVKKTVKVSSSFSINKISLKSFVFGSDDRPTYLKWVTKVSWLGLLAFFTHVCFGSRGIVEYCSRVQNLNSIKKETIVLNEENNALVYEINQIENSSTFQKKVVRDYLGYISKDEYLIIFPETSLL